MSEAFVLAVKAGVDPGRVYQAIRGGLAGSVVLDAKMTRVLSRNCAPGFRIKLHIKELKNVLATGRSAGAAMPLTTVIPEMMQALEAEGVEDVDHSAPVRFYEELAHTEVMSADQTH